ncbi:hypothetical protein MSAN_02382600 [Mycena sanguinolenta]|uniref:Uncharacterized protein n=1 Tax=Mycena sanguinolenta TaxID=230812 RepID=A0A8H7CG38_9AGAR|nr:hypothetical protein MSAN_02382600 [Mycena sanguinolenta]
MAHQILMANSTAELPNPFTPLAFLPPALATQFEVSRYLYAATLGAYVWDIGLNLGNDYTLLFKHKVRFPTIVYFFSRTRVITLTFIIGCFVLQVASVKNCNALERSVDICLVFSQTSTAMLFFIRVTAVWHPNKIAYAVFSILWLAVLGTSITAPLGIRGAHIGPTMQCTTTAVPANIEVSVIFLLINDTVIFLAINYRILAHTIAADSPMARLRAFFGGNGLSTLTQALLASGQHFYLVAVAANVTLLVVFHVNALYPAMLAVPAFALINAMACLVFRRIKFGLISSDGISKVLGAGVSSDLHATISPRSLPLHSRRTDLSTTEFRTNTSFPLEVRVQTDIDEFGDSQEISKTMNLS